MKALEAAAQAGAVRWSLASQRLYLLYWCAESTAEQAQSVTLGTVRRLMDQRLTRAALTQWRAATGQKQGTAGTFGAARMRLFKIWMHSAIWHWHHAIIIERRENIKILHNAAMSFLASASKRALAAWRIDASETHALKKAAGQAAELWIGLGKKQAMQKWSRYIVDAHYCRLHMTTAFLSETEQSWKQWRDIWKRGGAVQRMMWESFELGNRNMRRIVRRMNWVVTSTTTTISCLHTRPVPPM